MRLSMNLKLILIVICFGFSATGLAQQTRSIFEFDISKPKVCDTFPVSSNGTHRIQFYSFDSSCHVQQTYLDTILLRSDIFFHTTNPYRSSVVEYYPNGKIRTLAMNSNDTLIDQEFYENGSRKKYAEIFYDSASCCFNHENLKVINYHQNGSIMSEYSFDKIIYNYNEFWDNGEVRIKSDFVPCLKAFAGKYEEFDRLGRIIVRGAYEFKMPDCGSLYNNFKVGKWTYFHNGKKMKVEWYNEKGDKVKVKERT